MQSESATRLLEDVGRLVRDGRHATRWTQHDLERRSGVTQSRISRIERGRCPAVRLVEVDGLFAALGVRYRLDANLGQRPPYVRDAVHLRCATYVERRLEAARWAVRREVEVGSDRSRGWIDVLAFHRAAEALLVVEIKTELHDIGAIERSLNWYEREALGAARALGWPPRSVRTALLLLTTEANDRAIRANRAAVAVSFPGRSAALREVALTGVAPTGVAPTGAVPPRRFIATIDPRSRRREWLTATIVDGRRSRAPYVDYVDAARALNSGRVR